MKIKSGFQVVDDVTLSTSTLQLVFHSFASFFSRYKMPHSPPSSSSDETVSQSRANILYRNRYENNREEEVPESPPAPPSPPIRLKMPNYPLAQDLSCMDGWKSEDDEAANSLLDKSVLIARSSEEQLTHPPSSYRPPLKIDREKASSTVRNIFLNNPLRSPIRKTKRQRSTTFDQSDFGKYAALQPFPSHLHKRPDDTEERKRHDTALLHYATFLVYGFLSSKE